jgi:putative endonuclease
MREHCYYVYILANTFHRLYAGVTNDIMVRVKQHKSADNPKSFTARYGIDKLVYFESFQYINDAIAREKEIKGWLRVKKDRSDRSTQPDMAGFERGLGQTDGAV